MAMLSGTALGQRECIDLQGEWSFSCASSETVNGSTIVLPGSMPERMKGDDVTVNTKWVGSLYDSSYYFNPYMAKYRVKENIKFPFFLTPAKHYVGKAYYTKKVMIPGTWKKRKVVLSLERPHIVTTLKVNGQNAGSRNSLCVAHEYDVTDYIKEGENVLSVCVDNDPKLVGVGMDSHSVTDQTQGDWNGIVGKMELISMPMTHIEQVDVYPSVGDNAVKVVARISGKAKKAEAWIDVDGERVSQKIKVKDSIASFIITDRRLKEWNEFTPILYKVTVALDNGDSRTETFGMREIKAEGKWIVVNGRKTQMRGTVENCCFPNTGYAPMDKEEWLRVFRKCKEYGLNHMRFHSYCPPEAAFEAADEVGFYLQPEGPSWPNHGVSLGRGEMIDRYLMEETQRMVKAYGNHPSFAMLASGNEPRGNWVKWCSDFVDYWKQTDPRRIYTGASVGGSWQWQPKNQYHVKAGARGLTWDRQQPNSSDDFTREITSFYDKATRRTYEINEPFIAHEMGQWCSFPDFNEIPQYTGVYKARNFEIFRDLLADNDMKDMDRKFLACSGKLQSLCYKYEMEKLMRTPDYAGFQLLSLNDYSGQGSAIVGLLNVFFREKGYCDSKTFTEACAPSVILARFPKFTYSSNETLTVPVEMTNYTLDDMKNVGVSYRIDGLASASFGKKDVARGCNTQIGTIEIPLGSVKKASKFTLTLAAGDIENHYDFWVYPQVETTKTDVLITDTLDAKAIDVLKKGGKVLITAAGKIRYGNDVKQQYLPVFWNTSWFKMRPPHTTGAYIDNTHPIFKDFPTDDWTNLNWWELMNKQQVMQLTEFPKGFKPIVQSIDTWFVSRKIGMLFEANVLNGKVVMTSIDITHNLDRRIVARQLRESILKYMASDDFNPIYNIGVENIRTLFEKDAPVLDMYTKDSPDELKPKIN